jgi:hypothetical protein
LARTFVAEFSRAGVRIVIAGVHISSRRPTGWLMLQAMRLLLASYRPKLRIGQLIERTAPGSVLFSPTNFYDNDQIFLDDICAGQYPMPMRGVNRADALGRPVVYTGDDVAAWHEALDRRIPPGKKNPDCRASFRTLGRISIKTSAADLAETTRLLGRAPPGVTPTYVRDLARTRDVINRPDRAE